MKNVENKNYNKYSSNPSTRFTEVLIKIDSLIDELSIRNEITENNVQFLTTMTRRLYYDEMKNIDRIKIVNDLEKAIEKIISFSTIGDQILLKGEQLSNLFPNELHNITFDFTNIRSFKYPAIKDCKNALLYLKAHGHRSEVDLAIKLVDIRIIEFKLFSNVFLLNPCINDMMKNEFQRNDEENKTDRFIQLMNELNEYKEQAAKYQEKYKKAKAELKRFQSMCENMCYSLNENQKCYNARIKELETEIAMQDKEIRKMKYILCMQQQE